MILLLDIPFFTGSSTFCVRKVDFPKKNEGVSQSVFFAGNLGVSSEASQPASTLGG